LDKAKAAFKTKSIQASKRAHDQKYISAKEEHQQARGQYLKSLVYGGLDGIITTFAVVAGVTGASLSPVVILILGFANLIADGLSMAVGDYLSTMAENEYNQTERKREEWEVDHYPEGEKKEMIQLYRDKGMDPKDAVTITDILSKKKKAWVSVMMVEELGIVESEESPLRNALVTFFSFIAFGFIPLIAYVLSNFLSSIRSITFLIACILTGLTLFTLGAIKVKFTERNWFLSGLEMLLVGGIAASAAYGIGALVAMLV
jgi:VIT1/CCC1 family predicted Fe2+/Mn2+ transporter